MKKKAFTLIFSILFLSTLQAQIRAGFKAGGNISDMNMSFKGYDIDVYKPDVGFQVGVIAEKMFNPILGIQAELMYVHNSSSIKSDKYLEGIENPEGIAVKGHTDINMLQLPVYLKTKFNLSNSTRLYTMMGLYATYAPSAYQNIVLSNESESMKLKWSLFDYKVTILDKTESNSYMQTRWNTGAAFEAGFESNDWAVGANIQHTLTNMAAFGYLDIGKINTKMWTVSLSVSYFF